MNWYAEAERGAGFELHVLVLGMVLAMAARTFRQDVEFPSPRSSKV